MERKVIPVSLPGGLANEIDLLVKDGVFDSRSEALKFGARLVLMMTKRIHERSEDYAYEEIKQGIMKGKKADVS